jgi:hypothetical protein
MVLERGGHSIMIRLCSASVSTVQSDCDSLGDVAI